MSKQQADSARWSALMAKAQAGSEPDYQQLLTELGDVIQRYLHKRFGNQTFIEDCVQESLIAIHRARHTYDGDRPFRPWLFAIVRNKVIDFLRRTKSEQLVIESQRQQQASLAQNRQMDTLAQQIDNNNLLNALPNQQKEVIALTKMLGLSCAETAKQLGISESAVKVRVHRGINKLRQIMEAEEL